MNCDTPLTLLLSERPKLPTILVFLFAVGLKTLFQINQGFSDGLKKALPKYGVDKEKTKAFDGLQHEVHVFLGS